MLARTLPIKRTPAKCDRTYPDYPEDFYEINRKKCDLIAANLSSIGFATSGKFVAEIICDINNDIKPIAVNEVTERLTALNKAQFFLDVQFANKKPQ